jgi:hypothetical protein
MTTLLTHAVTAGSAARVVRWHVRIRSHAGGAAPQALEDAQLAAGGGSSSGDDEPPLLRSADEVPLPCTPSHLPAIAECQRDVGSPLVVTMLV